MQGQWPQVLGPCLLIHLSLFFQPLERGHVSEGVPSGISVLEGVLQGSIQIPPHHANSNVFPYLPSSGIEYNPGVLNRIECLPALVSMIMILCLRLGMVGSHRQCS